MQTRHEQVTPVLTVIRNSTKGSWQASLFWPDTRKRVRTLLHVPLDEDPSARYEQWKREVVPALIEEHELIVQEARTAAISGRTLDEVFTWFLDTQLAHAQASPKTEAHYERILRSFQTFCSGKHIARVQQVSWPIIQQWQIWLREHRGETRTAERAELSSLRHVFQEAHDARLIPEALDIVWKLPAKAKGTQFGALSMADTQRFYERLKIHAPVIFDPTWWIYLTGWLPSDTFDLRVCEADLVNGRIDRRRLKTDRAMHFPITEEVRRVIERNMARRSPSSAESLFLDPNGRQWDYGAYKKRLEYFCRKHFPEEVRPRDLRKTFATHMAAAGESPKVLKELMCHERIETTLAHYVDVDYPSLGEAAKRHHERFSGLRDTESLAA